MRSKILRSDAIDEQLHGRLLNWGRYLRHDNTYKLLGYPSKCPFTIAPIKGETISELDAIHIEEIISSFQTSKMGLLPVHATVLKIEYAEKSDTKVGAVEQRAKDVGRIFKCRCTIRGYYSMLYRARNAVAAFADPL